MKWRSSGGTIVTQHSTPSRTGEFSKRLLLARGGVFSCAKFELLSVGLGCAAGDVARVPLAGALAELVLVYDSYTALQPESLPRVARSLASLRSSRWIPRKNCGRGTDLDHQITVDQKTRADSG